MSDKPAKPFVRVIPGTLPTTHTEAPASFNLPVNFKTEDGQWFTAGLTIRGNSGPEAIENLLEALAYGKARVGMAVVRPAEVSGPERRAAAAQAPALRPVPGVGPDGADILPPPAPAAPLRAPAPTSPEAPPPAPRLNPAATGTAEGAPQTLYCVSLVITPKPDQKVHLEWMIQGHRMADIYTTWSLDRAVEMLNLTGEGWVAGDLVTAQRLTVRHAITWVYGKPNTAGGRYKDIVAIAAF